MTNEVSKLSRVTSPRVKIEVTDELIEASKGRDSSHCMIAEAVKVAYPEASCVAVDVQTIRWSDPSKGYRYTYLTPRTAQHNIVKFDRGDAVEPFSFILKGAQITKSGKTKSPKKINVDSEVQKAKGAKGGKVSKDITLPGGEGVLKMSHNGKVPTRVGGSPPPTTPFARRREFGLRAFVR
jgi:hypothetical protein